MPLPGGLESASSQAEALANPPDLPAQRPQMAQQQEVGGLIKYSSYRGQKLFQPTAVYFMNRMVCTPVP